MRYKILTLNIIASGLDIKLVPLNSLPATTCGFTIPSFCLTMAFSMYYYSKIESSG